MWQQDKREKCRPLFMVGSICSSCTFVNSSADEHIDLMQKAREDIRELHELFNWITK